MSSHSFANTVGNNVDTSDNIPIVANLAHQYLYAGKRRKLTQGRKIYNFVGVMVGERWIQVTTYPS